MTATLIPLHEKITGVRLVWNECQRCQYGELALHHVPFEIMGPAGRARPDSDAQPAHAMIIGEAPGQGEDALGRPFVGRSGRFLRTALDLAGIDGATDHVVITNLVACRPKAYKGQSENIPPERTEVRACRPRLEALIDLFEPKVIFLLGRYPEQYCTGILQRRPQIIAYAMKHPAALLRRGGAAARDYESYIEQFREGIELARKMRKP